MQVIFRLIHIRRFLPLAHRTTTRHRAVGLFMRLKLEGIAKAKQAGVYKGRPASINATQVRQLKAEGVSPSEIARRLSISRASVYRALPPLRRG